MMDELVQRDLIDVEGLLLFHYHRLGLNETQAVILLLVRRLEKNKVPYITPQLIAGYMSISDHEADQYLMGLITNNFLALNENHLTAAPLLKTLLKTLDSKPEEKANIAEKVDLMHLFEQEFARPLTPLEIEKLREWKTYHYNDEMIAAALKEATLSNVHNMRYIEKILVDWATHGMKPTGREKVDLNQEPVDLVDYRWWEDD